MRMLIPWMGAFLVFLCRAQEAPPNIYRWISENTYICSSGNSNEGSVVTFMDEREGINCSLCPEVSIGEIPRTACAVEVKSNDLDVNIGCFPIPMLCLDELRFRYGSFFTPSAFPQTLVSSDIRPQFDQTAQPTSVVIGSHAQFFEGAHPQPKAVSIAPRTSSTTTTPAPTTTTTTTLPTTTTTTTPSTTTTSAAPTTPIFRVQSTHFPTTPAPRHPTFGQIHFTSTRLPRFFGGRTTTQRSGDFRRISIGNEEFILTERKPFFDQQTPFGHHRKGKQQTIDDEFPFDSRTELTEALGAIHHTTPVFFISPSTTVRTIPHTTTPLPISSTRHLTSFSSVVSSTHPTTFASTSTSSIVSSTTTRAPPPPSTTPSFSNLTSLEPSRIFKTPTTPLAPHFAFIPTKPSTRKSPLVTRRPKQVVRVSTTRRPPPAAARTTAIVPRARTPPDDPIVAEFDLATFNQNMRQRSGHKTFFVTQVPHVQFENDIVGKQVTLAEINKEIADLAEAEEVVRQNRAKFFIEKRVARPTTSRSIIQRSTTRRPPTSPMPPSPPPPPSPPVPPPIHSGKHVPSFLKPTPPPVCEDKHKLCCFWALAGECDSNPYWMRINCAKTCGTCSCKLRDATECVSTGVKCTLPTTSTTTTTTTTTPTTTTPTTTTTRTTTTPTTTTTTTPATTRITTTPPHGFRRSTTRRRVIHTSKRSTTTPRPTTTRPPTTTSDPCFDLNENCPFWAALGECDSNPFWMRPHCQKSCRSCYEQVEDIFAPTPRDGCENSHRYCTFWAYNGECEKNPNWMVPHCPLSCRVC